MAKSASAGRATYKEKFAVAILVVAAGQSPASGKRLPGPAVWVVLLQTDFTLGSTPIFYVVPQVTRCHHGQFLHFILVVFLLLF